MHILKQIIQNKWTQYALAFVFFFCILGYLQAVPTIGDPDGFYHAGMARMLSQGKLLTTMPWMQFSTLRNSFTDHHFLYHLFLVPFVIVGNPLLGVKLATVGFSALFFVAFFAFLKRLRVSAPFLSTILVFLSSSFVFRLSLVKANSLSLIVFLAIMIALFEKRWKVLVLLNALYVWLYGGWFLGIGVALIFWFVAKVYRLLNTEPVPWYRRIFKKPDRGVRPSALVLSSFLGAGLGLVINPYWPQNLNFYLQQVWQIAVVNNGAVSGIGGEWSAMGLPEFAAFVSYIGIFFVIGIAILILQASRVHLRTWFSFVLAAICILFTLKSRRYIELSAPTMVLFASMAWSDIYPRGLLKQFWNSWQSSAKWIRDQLALSLFMGLLVLIALPNHGLWAQITVVRDEIGRGVQLHQYEGVSKWLSTHTPADSVVVQSDWDDWPMLWYYNQHNRYIVGLDPTFMYNENAELFKKWSRLTSDGQADNVVRLITSDLGSSFVIVDKDHVEMQRTLTSNIYTRLVYEDDDVWVYQMKPMAL